ncbi:hypothetical protein KQH91_05995 [Lactobacillus johnsonii]|uniref:hypothetical protein n=1 Tax=Lactobacillus johnsonii TaxID=33959 RepID=UPI001C0F5CB7|nr:hypothetical protein [Lactobacillus johnsonii]MBU5319072.1 hypothetical protein [Lactobacillus johnsonii]MDO5007444.1 hypothetical protein [Lactobacillus johnsonii]
MNTTIEKVNVQELATEALQGKHDLSDSTGHTLLYVYDPVTDKGDKFDKYDKK